MGFILLMLEVFHFFREWTRAKDYTIKGVSLFYRVNYFSVDLSEFWAKEGKKWDVFPDVFAVDVKDKTFLPLPECVADPVLKILYVFNNKEYVYTTRDLDFKWPPEQITKMSFVLPIKNAVLLDEEDNPIKNITREFTQCAGPRYDYHGLPVPLTDMIEKPFSKIRVTNIMNQQSIINLGGQVKF